MRKLCISALFLLAAASAVSQTLSSPGSRVPELSESATVSLITIYPGIPLYSSFGHSAFLIRDPELKLELMFNYGQSEVPFDAAFVPRFVFGNMRFVLGVSRMNSALSYYRQVEDRSVVEQKLDLTNGEIRALFAFLLSNAKPENRSYIYDFYFDNCVTRIRDAMRALYGDAVTLIPNRPEKLTFREEIKPYLADKQWLRFGIDMVLGPYTDRTATDDESLFLPLRMMSAIDNAVIRRDGKEYPLMSRKEVLYESTRVTETNPLESPAIPLSLLLVIAFLLSFRPLWARSGKISRIAGKAARVFDSILFPLAGLAGIGSILLWAFSGYVVTSWNLNLLWLIPTHLFVPFILGKRTIAGNVSGKILLVYFITTAVLAAGLALTIPWLPQKIPVAAVMLMLTYAVRSIDRFREIRGIILHAGSGRQ